MCQISVVLSTYNHDKYLAECIDSVLSQTYEDFEFIIVDNGSTDHTRDVLKNYSDGRIKVIRLDANYGAGSGYRAGLDEALGEYVSMICSDDVYEPEKLELQYQFLSANPKYAAVFSYPSFINEESHPIIDNSHKDSSVFYVKNRKKEEWLNHFFFNGNCLCFPSVLVRKDVIDKIKPNYRLRQLGDLYWWINICFYHEIHIIEKKLLRYRIRADNANESGLRADVYLRHIWEMVKVLTSYSNLPEDIFHQVFGLPVTRSIKYSLAQIALGINSPVYQAVGLDLWYESLDGDDFDSYVGFYEVTGKFDLFKTLSLPLDFNSGRYLAINPDIQRSGMDPRLHYAWYGRNENRRYK